MTDTLDSIDRDSLTLANLYVAQLRGDAVQRQIDQFEEILKARYPKEFKSIVLKTANLALNHES